MYINTMSFKEDYIFGKQNEVEILDSINNLFNDNIELIEDTYSRYDYKGDKYHYELKSRKNNYQAYPTTLIPYSKIQKGIKIILLFKFYDGLYYIKFTKKKFKNFDLKPFVRNQRVDYNDKLQLYYFIPIEHLKKIV